MRAPNPKVELASGEFDRRKQHMTQPGIAVVARLFGIRTEALKCYRANHLSRKTRTATAAVADGVNNAALE